MTDRRKILVVEDSVLIAMEVKHLVEDCGCGVVGPAATVARALAAIDSTPDLAGAVLDVNLDGEWIWPVVDRLQEESIPFMLTTGYGRRDIPEGLRDLPIIVKPVTAASIRRGLEHAAIL